MLKSSDRVVIILKTKYTHPTTFLEYLGKNFPNTQIYTLFFTIGGIGAKNTKPMIVSVNWDTYKNILSLEDKYFQDYKDWITVDIYTESEYLNNIGDWDYKNSNITIITNYETESPIIENYYEDMCKWGNSLDEEEEKRYERIRLHYLMLIVQKRSSILRSNNGNFFKIWKLYMRIRIYILIRMYIFIILYFFKNLR